MQINNLFEVREFRVGFFTGSRDKQGATEDKKFAIEKNILAERVGLEGRGGRRKEHAVFQWNTKCKLYTCLLELYCNNVESQLNWPNFGRRKRFQWYISGDEMDHQESKIATCRSSMLWNNHQMQFKPAC